LQWNKLIGLIGLNIRIMFQKLNDGTHMKRG
jgi:hypothetical protein